MPSTELESAKFTSIDWSDESGGWRSVRYRSVGLVAALLLVAALFTYDYVAAPRELFAFMDWDVTRMDWLFLVSTVLFVRYALVPLAVSRERSSTYVREFVRRPAGVLSLGYILFFGVMGLVGPEWFGLARVDFYAKVQPPVFTSVNTGNIRAYNCVGKVAGNQCHGTWQYPLGTTRVGEDVAKVIVYAIRIGLKLALSAAMIMVVVATAVGTAAGYFGGWVDDVLMRYVDVQQTVPAIVVYIILSTMYLGKGLFALALVFGLLDWGGIARLVRSEVLQRRTDGYVRAAQAAGASDLHVVRKHVIPNSTATIVTALTRQIPLLILAQVALAYLKLNSVAFRSLGEVLMRGLSANPVPWHQRWWVTGFITLFLVVTVVSFNVFGDVVRDVLDPQEEVA
ncbi:ABC transporter permease [Halobacterium litoreum]|uniref:ABC transporter permease n=1 Tax=Halobacterium litoreum TaxID=2039234 RepID=A0ABD5NH02_9EURY|nr:ABC transporter permease [Halobacterium litoreum]UHH12791.1 ABC transporter permease [Halobacterium litoreum]